MRRFKKNIKIGSFYRGRKICELSLPDASESRFGPRGWRRDHPKNRDGLRVPRIVVVRMTALILKHANKNRLGAIDWGPNDFDVLDAGRCVGLIMSAQAPQGRPWFWTITAIDYPPTIHSAAIPRHANKRCRISSGSRRVSGPICQSANVTTPLTAANRRRKASLSPALALSRRRLPISALVVRDFSSGLKDSHVSSNTVCKSWSVSGVKAFIVQTLTKPPSGWGRARRLRTPEIEQRGRRRLISHYSLV